MYLRSMESETPQFCSGAFANSRMSWKRAAPSSSLMTASTRFSTSALFDLPATVLLVDPECVPVVQCRVVEQGELLDTTDPINFTPPQAGPHFSPAPRQGDLHVNLDRHRVDERGHRVEHGLPEPRPGGLRLVLVGLDHDLVMHRQDRHRPGAVPPPLPEQRQGQLEPVGPRALDRSVQLLRELADAQA